MIKPRALTLSKAMLISRLQGLTIGKSAICASVVPPAACLAKEGLPCSGPRRLKLTSKVHPTNSICSVIGTAMQKRKYDCSDVCGSKLLIE